MAILVDSSQGAISGFANTETVDVTLLAAGNGRALAIHTGVEFTGSTGDVPTAVTVNGTSVIANLIDTGDADFRYGVSYYALEADLPASAGTYEVSVTWGGSSGNH